MREADKYSIMFGVCRVIYGVYQINKGFGSKRDNSDDQKVVI